MIQSLLGSPSPSVRLRPTPLIGSARTLPSAAMSRATSPVDASKLRRSALFCSVRTAPSGGAAPERMATTSTR